MHICMHAAAVLQCIAGEDLGVVWSNRLKEMKNCVNTRFISAVCVIFLFKKMKITCDSSSCQILHGPKSDSRSINRFYR